MSAVFKQSWFWSALAGAGAILSLSASLVFGYGRSTKENEASIAALNTRVAAIEEVDPAKTRWLVEQEVNFHQEIKGDITSIKASIRKIELSLARTNPTLGSKD